MAHVDNQDSVRPSNCITPGLPHPLGTISLTLLTLHWRQSD